MLSPQCILVGPVSCWGSGSIEQASGVALEEQEVMVVSEPVMEVEWQEESCIGASTLVEVHSTEVVVGHVSETNEQWFEYGIEVDKTTEEMWTRKDEQGGPKKVCEKIGWDNNKLGMSLSSPTDKVWAHAAFFG